MKQSRSDALRAFSATVAVAAVLLPLILSGTEWPRTARDYLEERGAAESGAVNLVSAIYLGYRAFDTLGETIVLLVAVSGSIGIATQAGAVLAKGYGKAEEEQPAPFALPGEKRKTHAMRTHLVETVTGKLGPIVLLFGLYVMLYGHLSPGGGFQGGVVVASGVVFLALGSRAESDTILTRAATLSRLEAAAFLLLILASISSVVVTAITGEQKAFFSTPFAPSASPVNFIVLLNAVIGLKVGAGIGFMCIAMLGREQR
jgi:multicomponent Na+:H+ antiporter subunit B